MSSHQRRIQRRLVQRHSFVAWLMWVRRNALRILARKLHDAVVAIAERCKTLALPAPKTNASMLAKAVALIPPVPTYAYSNIPKVRRLG